MHLLDDGMNVDGSQSERELTLVKVPEYISKEWKRMIQESMSTADGPAAGCTLAQLHVGAQTEMELPEKLVQDTGIPSRYNLVQQGQRSQTHVISHSSNQYKVEGVIRTTYSAAPKRSLSSLDPGYQKMVKQSEAKSNTPAGECKLDTTVQKRTDRLDAEKKLLSTGERKKLNLSTKEFEEQKDVFEAKLFAKFELQAFWKTADLMSVMGLSGPQLSQLLKDIAVMNAAGPYKKHWSLKKEYQTSKE